jgi:deoxyribonuclease-4
MQLFTALPQFYNERIAVKPERIERFKRAIQETSFDSRFVLAHSAYVLNTASPEAEKQARARAGLAKELERATSLGILGCCFHPGSAGKGDMTAAIDRVAEAITHAIESVGGDSRVFVENTAGAGRTVGRNAKEVAAILDRVPGHLRRRTGYGLDTCHLFVSGHDLRRCATALREVLDEFVEATGERPSFFHLNDSESGLGSNRDRHSLIGEGEIGLEPFRWLLADERTHDVPLILETPQLNMEPPDDDDTPDEYDVRMMALLATLSGPRADG